MATQLHIYMYMNTKEIYAHTYNSIVLTKLLFKYQLGIIYQKWHEFVWVSIEMD